MENQEGSKGKEMVAVLTPFWSLGLASKVSNALFYADDLRMGYPAGRHVAMFNTETKEVVFAPQHDKVRAVVAIAVSPKRKYLAISERTPENRAQVSIIHIGNNKRLKTLVFSDAKEFVALGFSADGRYLTTQGGAPDHLLVYWQWDRAKILGFVKMPSKVTCVSVNPNDSMQLCTSGPRLLRLWRMVEAQLKGFNLLSGRKGDTRVQAKDLPNVTGHVWLGNDILATCTDRGDVCLYECVHGNLTTTIKNVFPVGHGATAIARYAKGFVVGGTGGHVKVYEKSLDKDQSTMLCIREHTTEEHHAVNAVSVSPSTDAAMLCFDDGQLGVLNLGGGLEDVPAGEGFSYLFKGFHSLPVTGMDVSVAKPLVITCGGDSYVRVWNYVTKMCEAAEKFDEEPVAVAAHPGGFQFLIAFHDRVSLYSLLLSGFKLDHDFAIKQCREIQFSHGGHMFACSSQANCVLYGTYSRELITTFTGHTGPIRSIGWSEDDKRLVTAGVDGAVYEWNVHGMKRTAEFVIRRAQFMSVVLHGASRAFVCGTDRILRELDGGQLKCELQFATGAFATQVLVVGRLLIVGTSLGTVRIYRTPLAKDARYTEHGLHNGAIRRMALSFNGRYLFTAGDDGAVFVCNLQSVEGGRILPRRALDPSSYTDVVMIMRTDIDESLERQHELETKLRQQQSESVFQDHQKDQHFAELIAQQQEDFARTRKADERRLLDMQRQKDQLELNATDMVQTMEAAHMKAAEELETLYEKKLEEEAQQVKVLRERIEDLQCQFEEREEVLLEEHNRELARIEKDREADRARFQEQMEALEEQMREMEKDYQEEIRQQEEEHDMELAQTSGEARAQLAAEKLQTSNLRGEASLLRKRFQQYHTLKSKMEGTIQNTKEEVARKDKELGEQRKVISILENEVKDRQKTISQKERRIFELKQKKQELEKFRYVLDFKVSEMRKEMEPKEEQIVDMKNKILEMDNELQRHIQNGESYVWREMFCRKYLHRLQRQVNDKVLKIETLYKELSKVRSDLQDKSKVIKGFVQDIHDLYTQVDGERKYEKKKIVQTDVARWRDGIRQLYTTYVTQDAARSLGKQDHEQQLEFARQREYMERSLKTLRHKAAKVDSRMKVDVKRKLYENTVLISELSELRRDKRELEVKLQKAKDRLARFQHQKTDQKRSAAAVRKLQLREEEDARMRGQRVSEARGKVYRGSPLKQDMSPLQQRQTIKQLIANVEDSNRVIESQRTEIARLSHQLDMLTSSARGMMTSPPGRSSARSGRTSLRSASGSRHHMSREKRVAEVTFEEPAQEEQEEQQEESEAVEPLFM